MKQMLQLLKSCNIEQGSFVREILLQELAKVRILNVFSAKLFDKRKTVQSLCDNNRNPFHKLRENILLFFVNHKYLLSFDAYN